ncbi:hypothetical protein Dimus_007103 [Dionaea muscipula]
MEVLGFVISSKRSTTMWGGVCLILSSIMVISLTIIMYGDSYFMNKYNGGFFKAHFKGEPNQFQEDAQNATSCRAAIEGAAATATLPAPAPAPAPPQSILSLRLLTFQSSSSFGVFFISFLQKW